MGGEAYGRERRRACWELVGSKLCRGGDRGSIGRPSRPAPSAIRRFCGSATDCSKDERGDEEMRAGAGRADGSVGRVVGDGFVGAGQRLCHHGRVHVLGANGSVQHRLVHERRCDQLDLESPGWRKPNGGMRSPLLRPGHLNDDFVFDRWTVRPNDDKPATARRKIEPCCHRHSGAVGGF